MREYVTLIIALGFVYQVRAQQTLPIQVGTWSVQHTYILGSQTETETATFEYIPIFDSYLSEGLNWGLVSSFGSFFGMPMPDRIAVDSGRVYYRPEWGDTTAQVLYDFNLVAGDTAYIDWNWQAAVVELADTITVAGRSWRHLELSNEDEWFECMGSIYGLFRPCCFSYFEEYFELTWFEAWCMDPDLTEFDIHWPFDQSVVELSQPDIQVFPNPTTGMFTLRTASRQATFSIHDPIGTVVRRGVTQAQEAILDMSALPVGVYVVRAEDRCVKVVVQ